MKFSCNISLKFSRRQNFMKSYITNLIYLQHVRRDAARRASLSATADPCFIISLTIGLHCKNRPCRDVAVVTKVTSLMLKETIVLVPPSSKRIHAKDCPSA